MAIDTAAKRRAAGGLPFPLGPGVTPNASRGPRWRLQAAWGYAGLDIVAATGALASGVADITGDASALVGVDGVLASAAALVDGIVEAIVGVDADLLATASAVDGAIVSAVEEFHEFLHPDADDDVGNWTNNMAGLPLYTAIDEAVGA